MEKKEAKPKKHKTAISFALEFVIKIAVTALIVFGLLYFVFGFYVNHTNTSYPMIKDGDLCLYYRLKESTKGDAVVYEAKGEKHIGRIVALPGDVVDIKEEKITINGRGVYEDAVYPTPAEGSSIAFPYTVPEGTVFVLNDYRSDVKDSRTYGGIEGKKIKGRIILLLRVRGI